jgi:hypothetical protein
MVDLDVFCDPTTGPETRYDLSTPWVYDGWRYATDGRICVRELAPGEPSSPDVRAVGSTKGNRPRAHDIFAGFPKKGFTGDWPAAEYGEDKRECSCCGVLHECEKCNGRGHEYKASMIAGRRIAGWAVARIGLLDGVKFRFAGDKEDAICFIDAHGRQGKVMPMVPK